MHARLDIVLLPALIVLRFPSELSAARPADEAARIVTGVVFDDLDDDGTRDPGEPPLPNVRISNGREVTSTDDAGRYKLPIDDDAIIFVIKPRDYMCPVDRDNVPRFYRIHKPGGSPANLEFEGVAPTGPLPASVDFPLQRRLEPNRFKVIMFGDPQARNVEEVNFLAHDVVSELIGTDAAFGVALGDVAFDNLSVYGPLCQTIGRIGIPWYYVHGNHDQNYDVTTDGLADETWERVFGPTTFSFDWGPVHFIIVDDVVYDGHEERGRYHGEFGPDQLAFIANDLQHVPKDALVVLMMHIPLPHNSGELFKLLRDRPNTLSISAHQHYQQHIFLGPNEGWLGEKPHHHLIHATVCGSWWAGTPDELGIPHATMGSGAPNGYSIITFDRTEYSIRFKAARRPDDHQMHIDAPNVIAEADAGTTEIVVNVYAGSERSTVEMRVDGVSGWSALRREVRHDPAYVRMKDQEQANLPPIGREIPKPYDVHHLWVGTLPANLPAGAHVVRVRTFDMFGQEDQALRVIRVTPTTAVGAVPGAGAPADAGR
jgi:hypothetical protein